MLARYFGSYSFGIRSTFLPLADPILNLIGSFFWGPVDDWLCSAQPYIILGPYLQSVRVGFHLDMLRERGGAESS
jgi:hypothetical protein